MVWAVVTAAGSGERLGLDRPKAFAKLRDRPLLAECLERLDASEWIEAIVVVVPEGWEEPAALVAEEVGAGKVVASIAGGLTRVESVRRGVAEVPEDATVILVHDAARPLVDNEVVARVLAPLGEGWDGAVPALPVNDTIKRVRDDEIVETLPRDDLIAVQTPQAFVASVFRQALRADVAGATDCASLVEEQNGRVRWVPGEARLHKVTEPADLDVIERLLAA